MSASAPRDQDGSGRPQSTVGRRAVFYIAGFDPQGPGHYHRLFTEQAAAQSAVTDYALSVGPRASPRAHVSCWDVTFTTAGGDTVHTHYQFLRWDDVVRQHWPRGLWRLAMVTLGTTGRLMSNGSWHSMCRLSWVAGLTIALPAAVGLIGVSSAAAGCAFLWALTGSASHTMPALAGYCLGALTAFGSALMLPRLWRYGQGDWLMRSTASLLRYARDQAPEVDTRIADWSEAIKQSFTSGDHDEVLVVAHSSGCIAAVAAVSQAIKATKETRQITKPLSLLTLGQCIPVLSHQPEAKAIRTALTHLGQSEALTWVDVSAPPDACCFALSDPRTTPCAAGGATASVKRLSPRYAEQMDSDSYRELKSDKLRCHFQYLMAFKSPKYYDFFSWVCGPQTLAQTTQQLQSVTNFNRFRW